MRIEHLSALFVFLASLVSPACSCDSMVGTNPPPESTEECGNGLDDDEDDRIDEDCFCAPSEAQDCFPNGALGACGPGSMTCEAPVGTEWGTWGTCREAPEPGEEVCEGSVDEDCDGTTDEGCACTAPNERACGASSVGACQLGTQRCVDGTWSGCEGAVFPRGEICANGVDDDCDGIADEPSVCDCRPEPELCDDGVDNDCDGIVDEPDACDATCEPMAETCGNGTDDDCDARVDEGAEEICGDGIDQDCDGSDLVCPPDAGPADQGPRDAGTTDAGPCPGGVCPVPCTGTDWEQVVTYEGQPSFGFHVSDDGRRVIYPGGVVGGDGTPIATLRDDIDVGFVSKVSAISVGPVDIVRIRRSDGFGGLLRVDAAGGGSTLGPVERARTLWRGPFVLTEAERDGVAEPVLILSMPNTFGEPQWPFGVFLSDGALHRFATLTSGGEEYDVVGQSGGRVHGARPVNADDRIDTTCANNVGQRPGAGCRFEWVIADVATPATALDVVSVPVPVPGYASSKPAGVVDGTLYLWSRRHFDIDRPAEGGIHAVTPDGTVTEVWAGFQPQVPVAFGPDAAYVRDDDAPHQIGQVDLATGTFTAIPYPDYFTDTRPARIVINEATSCIYASFADGALLSRGSLTIARRALP